MDTELIRILLVDDHDVVRDGIRVLVNGQEDMEVVGEAANGLEAVHLTQTLEPDVILMDITMPNMDGLEATRQVVACCTSSAVLALTIHEGREYFFAMLQAGAAGYIPKRAPTEELMTAIRAVNRGEVYLHPSVAKLLLQDYLRPSKQQDYDDGLTDREREVLRLVAEGHMNRVIGERLGISPKTVARHRENMMRKLGLHSRAELVKYALNLGLLEVDNDQ